MKTHICDTCGAQFLRGSNLKAHVRIHTGEKPYKCDTCGAHFSSKGILNIHERVHTGENPINVIRVAHSSHKIVV